MIRLKGIKFDKVVKRYPRLGESQFFFGEDSHIALEALVRIQSAKDAGERANDISIWGSLGCWICTIHNLDPYRLNL